MANEYEDFQNRIFEEIEFGEAKAKNAEIRQRLAEKGITNTKELLAAFRKYAKRDDETEQQFLDRAIKAIAELK